VRYVIVGYGIAGVSAVREIRRYDPSAKITIITAEPLPPYYRPLVSLLIHAPDRDINLDTGVQDGEVIMDRAVDLRPGEVILSSGEKVPYDRLLISTGGVPIVPPIDGLPPEGVFTIRKREDALAIARYAEGCESAAVIGGGLVGVKTAESLWKRGLEVSIVEMTREILHGRLSRTASGIIRQRLEERGLRIYTSTKVERVVKEGGRKAKVILSSGDLIKTEMIVIATGMRPSIDWIASSGVKISKGIVVDEHMETSLDNVYAAGDVVEFTDLATGIPSQSGLWLNALEMGKVAGANMTGRPVKYPGLLSIMNSTEVMGIPFVSAGMIEPGRGCEVIETFVPTYRRLVFEGDILKGIVFLEDVEKAGLYVNLIKSPRGLGQLKDKAIEGRLSYIDLWHRGTIRP